ncbi:hypothetical protein CC1G_04700 [Coprinopsis cinerea okayama7|uniref:Uncharacterized protein n=1 Tax=Coprinopsis cinerea (strain Okayama-7 / 130 / ATCC MYA-4618 / FGSC 9003) TaxID=240176 RepID=A8P275_COPC7|nr:hypothetical protein CC1G_04700 [Coprinopsis cinerea okayama7\|eukprot:XP_001838256.1 hypothetical protein CC1G_04700 [Coprinopsis cinerea okayama7\
MPLCEGCGRLNPGYSSKPTADELADEIIQIEALMSKLSERRTIIRRRINTLAPISRLPSEILLEIFTLYCKAEPDTEAPHPSPLFLGSVCVAWRTLVWSTPLLWRSIHINVSLAHRTRRADVLLEWLMRARSVPLHIKLTATEEDEDVFSSIRSTMAILLRRSEQWGSIDCILPPQCHDMLAAHRFPNLKSVTFRPPKGTISTFSRPPDMFLNTPSLTDVDLSGYDYSSMVLPWHQLHKFRTQFLRVAECLAILHRSPNLIHCDLDHIYSVETAPNSLSPPNSPNAPSRHIHENLEVLELGFIKGSAAESFFNSVSLPSLRELALHFGHENSVAFPPTFLRALHSSAAFVGLQKLSLSQGSLDDQDVIQCLELLPTLVELKIRNTSTSSFGDSIFDAPKGLSRRLISRLYRREGDPKEVLVPKLRYFEYEGNLVCGVGDLVNMLAWRLEQEMGRHSGVEKLESFVLVVPSCATLDEGQRSLIRSLAERGVDLRILQRGKGL